MKLITLLKALRPEEHHEFEKFLQSPYFKASDMYVRFFREISKRSATFDLDKAGLHDAYIRCFGKKSLNETKWYNLASGLKKQIEQFLVVQSYSVPDAAGETPLFDQMLVKALESRNMGVTFRTEAERVIDKTLARNGLAPDDYMALHQIHQQVYFNPDTQKFIAKSAHLQSAVEYLDQYFCMEKLRFAAEMKAREFILGGSYNLPMLDAVLEYSNAGLVSEKYPLWAMYRDLVIYYKEGGGASEFRNLVILFKEQFGSFSKNDRVSISRHLINIGISLISRHTETERTLLDLYKHLEEAQLLLDDNRITHLTFINISNLAAVCEDFEWGRNFITRYASYLEDNKRAPTINLAMAAICYYEKKLTEAATFLTPEITRVPPFDLLNLGLAIKIVFDRYWLYGIDYEYLTSQMDAFKRFIRHRKMPQEKKNAYLNWINFLRKMTAVRFQKAGPVPVAMKIKLRSKLMEIQPIVFKNWTAAKLKS